MKKSVFFDLVGTLWDALDQITDCWNEAMVNNNEPYRFTKELIRSTMGLTPIETYPIAFPGTDEEEGMRLFKICLDAELIYLAKNPGKLYPFEEEVLEKLSSKYPLYIVSNADKGYIQNYLKLLF